MLFRSAGLAHVRGTEIGFVFQAFQLLARTNARDNVALPLVYRGVGRTERRRRAVAALEAVGLGHRLTHRPTQLSGGEQQRVAIARALVGEPRLVLADEPTGNLDTANGHEVLNVLERLNRERGVAVVLVTHDAEVAARAVRLIRMRDGVVVSDTRRAEQGQGRGQGQAEERTEGLTRGQGRALEREREPGQEGVPEQEQPAEPNVVEPVEPNAVEPTTPTAPTTPTGPEA